MAPKGYGWKVTVVIRVHAHRMGQDHFRVTSELLFAAVVLRDRMSLSSYHPRARNSSVWVSFPASSVSIFFLYRTRSLRVFRTMSRSRRRNTLRPCTVTETAD